MLLLTSDSLRPSHTWVKTGSQPPTTKIPPKTTSDHRRWKWVAVTYILWSAIILALVIWPVGHNRSAKGPRLLYDCRRPSHVDRCPSAISRRPSHVDHRPSRWLSYNKSLPIPPICTDCCPLVGDWSVTEVWRLIDNWSPTIGDRRLLKTSETFCRLMTTTSLPLSPSLSSM